MPDFTEKEFDQQLNQVARKLRDAAERVLLAQIEDLDAWEMNFLGRICLQLKDLRDRPECIKGTVGASDGAGDTREGGSTQNPADRQYWEKPARFLWDLARECKAFDLVTPKEVYDFESKTAGEKTGQVIRAFIGIAEEYLDALRELSGNTADPT